MRMSSDQRRIPTLVAAACALAVACAGCGSGDGETKDLCKGVVCTTKDQCHEVGECDAQTGTCSAPLSASTKTCNDGIACTEGDHCSNGTCAGTPKVCHAKDACHEAGQCDTQTGLCSDPVAADAKTCDDGFACTESDHCSAGTCTGAPKVCTTGSTCDPTDGVCKDKCTGVVCHAKDACHEVGQCDLQTGTCSDPVSANTKTCNDNLLCTEGDHCSAGACTGTAKVCQTGSCDALDGVCKDKCAGVVCQAKDVCHEAGQCNAQTGTCSDPVSADTKTCNDNLLCTEGDHCSAGICTGAQKVCTTGNTCDPVDGACKASTGPQASVAVQQGGALGLTLGLAYDEHGFIYEAGNMFQPGFDFGSGLINSAGSLGSDVFVAKLNPATGRADIAGTWAKDFGDASNDQAVQAMAVSSGQVGFIGQFTGLMDVGGGHSQNNNGQSIDFVAGLDRNTGAGLWINSYDLNDPALVTGGKLNGIASSPSQTHFAVCGYAFGKVPTLVNDPAAAIGGGLDIVVSVIDAATGNVVWGKQFGGAGDQVCTAVTFDDAGDVVITGQHKDTLAFGAIALTGPTGANSFAYVAKLNGATGAPIAAVTYGATPTCRAFPRAIAVDGSGNVLTTGQVQGKIAFGATALTATGTTLDVYIAKLDSGLNPLWAQRLGGTAVDDGRGIAADSSGQVYVTGVFDQTTTGVASLTTFGGADAFLLRLDPTDGHLTYADHYGDPNAQEGQTLVAERFATGAEKDYVWSLGTFVIEITFPGQPKVVGSPETRHYLVKMK